MKKIIQQAFFQLRNQPLLDRSSSSSNNYDDDKSGYGGGF